MSPNQVRVVKSDPPDQLGEGVTWSASRNSIFWVDILAPALQRYDLATGAVTRWEMPEPIGWIVERKGREDYLIGLQSGFAALDLNPFSIHMIGDPEEDRPHNRLNDAKVDAAGRLWAGSKDHRDEERSGALYRLDPDLTWSKHDDGYAVTNGPTFSLDGHTLYHTDSPTRTIYAFDLDDRGVLENKRVFVTFEDTWGHPDGMTTDSEGGVWVAHWGGHRVTRFTPGGQYDRSIEFPASQITNCAFGGAELDRLYVTSAAVGKPGEKLAGALFEVSAGIKGIAPTLFAG